MAQIARPTAVVMNMFYTGLGIARSLGSRGIPVLGLSAQSGVYGNFTRHARVLRSPDSRNESESLLSFLLALADTLPNRAVLFPTRDDDLLFIERFRGQLASRFELAVSGSEALRSCLNKWETYRFAVQAGIPTPRSWLIENRQAFESVVADVSFPCVLKPVSAHVWRKSDNWKIVGARKAIGIESLQHLRLEYEAISRADVQVLIQEMIPGADDCLVIAACYVNRRHEVSGYFNTRKLVQVPAGFGTGCIVQSADYPELFEPAARLLEAMRFTGIAEVEFKWNQALALYQLIEVNPRPWDQHRLGVACGVDLIYLAYCECAGLTPPNPRRSSGTYKWIAEDTFAVSALRLLWRRDIESLRHLFCMAAGRRIYAIWTASDPLPSLGYLTTKFIPDLASAIAAFAVARIRGGDSRKPRPAEHLTGKGVA